MTIIDENNIDEQYAEIEKNFVQPDCKVVGFKELYTFKLMENIRKKIRERSLSDKLDPNDYHDRLVEMYDFVGNLYDALNGYPLKSDIKKECHEIWYHRTEEQIIGIRKIHKEHFINRDELLDTLSIYLTNPWLQLDLIDWIFLDSLVFDQIESYREEIYSGKTIGKENWNYILARGDLNEFNLLEIKKSLSTIGFLYILPLSIIGILFYIGLEDIAIFPTIGFIIFVLFKVSLFPFRIFKKRKAVMPHLVKLGQMCVLYHYCKPPILSLETIDRCLDKAIKNDINFDGALFALVKRIRSVKEDLFLPYT